MRTNLPATLAAVAAAALALAAITPATKRLTPQRLFEIADLPEVPDAESYTVEISEIGRAKLPREKREGVITSGPDLRVVIEFDPPKVSAPDDEVVLPMTPTVFERIPIGWSIRLSAKRNGSLIGIYGVADHTESEMVPGAYGATAGPIYSPKGHVISTNEFNQPKLQTTTTRFHVYAVPGESYEITLYRGGKPETHTLTVKAD